MKLVWKLWYFKNISSIHAFRSQNLGFNLFFKLIYKYPFQTQKKKKKLIFQRNCDFNSRFLCCHCNGDLERERCHIWLHNICTRMICISKPHNFKNRGRRWFAFHIIIGDPTQTHHQQNVILFLFHLKQKSISCLFLVFNSVSDACYLIF